MVNWHEGHDLLCSASKERHVNPSNSCLSLLSLSPGLPCRVSAASSCRLLIFVCVTIVSPDCLVLQWPDSVPRKQSRLYSLHSLGPDDPRADPIIAWLQLASRHSHFTLSQPSVTLHPVYLKPNKTQLVRFSAKPSFSDTVCRLSLLTISL